MSGYEDEHNIPKDQQSAPQERRRPDMTTFFSAIDRLDYHDPAHPDRHSGRVAPEPGNISALYNLLADSLAFMEREGHTDVASQMLAAAQEWADNPPREVDGVPDSFLDGLERVPKKELKKDDTCPICGMAFLDDQFPLVVELPCHSSHRFDLDCIRPWLKLNSTCPLDRKNLLKKKEPTPPPQDEEEEYDDMYA
ncbi:uncharacterized protein K452DRAFT_323005 [Aplosporella prunicola CBS 121167]|uniref:RING-type domain-containing protein n=1 Tax=Aplosporella prunicola CBS 121167 TaxID=1176127 RepID=A0A6A6AVB8_9PEZI|nr:uncharacterized protein K452DRAFT_323005 [Aplosporella prunicola CBS 121167]KAF2135536.1 hypothetical protein K452DRAFT_323005 [Aplosporella prunicola CBS 121167]